MRKLFEEIYEFVEKELKTKGENRYINVDYYTVKSGWSYIEDKNRVTIKTNLINRTPPYITESRRKTFKLDLPKEELFRRIKIWVVKVRGW